MQRLSNWVAWLRLEPEDFAPLLAPILAVFIAVAAYDVVLPELAPASAVWARLGLAVAIWGAIHVCLGVASRAWRRVISGVRSDASARERALVTELMDAQERAEARLARIVAGAPVGIATVGADGVIESWNPAARAILGFRPEEIVGRPIGTVIPRMRAAVPHGDGGAVLADFVTAPGRVRGRANDGDGVDLRLRVTQGADFGRPVYTAFFERLVRPASSTAAKSSSRSASA